MKALSFLLALLLLPLAADAYTISTNTTVGSTSGNIVNDCGFASNDTGLCAQRFTTVAAGKITSLNMKFTRGTGGLPGDYKISIQADSAGSPSGSDLGSSGLVSLNTVAVTAGDFKCQSSSPTDTTFTWSSPVSLSAATTYWAVLTPNVMGSEAGQGLRWCGDDASAHSEVTKHTTTTTSTWVTNTTMAAYMVSTISTGSFSFWQFGWSF